MTDPVERLRGYLIDGDFEAGCKLPPERRLSEELGLPRASLRKALDILERENVIHRHVGRGTFVSDGHSPTDTSSLIALGRNLTPMRMMRARSTIEPALAREAALQASGDALRRIRAAMERAHSASNWSDYEAHDDLFHRAIAEASDNPLLLTLFDQLNQVRRAVAWGSVTRQTPKPARSHSSFGEHENILIGIESRDPAAAEEAMRLHLRSVSLRLFEQL